MYETLTVWRAWAENQQNYVFAANQALHNFFLVWFAAVPWFLWLAARARTGAADGAAVTEYVGRLMDRCARITFWVLLLVMASGANFGAIDWLLYGEFRDIGTVPRMALGIKIALATVSLGVLFYLWWFLGPQLRELPADATDARAALERRRLRLWGVLAVLGPVILAAAALLRFTS